MRECPTCLRCFNDEVVHCPDDGQATINSLSGTTTLDGRYVLDRRLGQGGMGVVYKAHHVFLRSIHAIKIIVPDLVGNDSSVATRFRQEAMAAAAIRHTNIISVTDYGFAGQSPFLVMEFVEGKSLQDVMTEVGKFTPEMALEYFKPIAAGVGEAHRQKIIHRDLKPLNIMLLSGRSVADGLRILDFGLAKIKSGELLGSFVGVKTTGIIGSPYYMAPEQWSDEESDKRCDVYSLGIILHQMLTGDVPFKGSSIPAVMKKHLMTPPPPLASTRTGVSEALERVVHHALEKEPPARTASVEDLLLELEEAIREGSRSTVKKATKRRSRVRSSSEISAVGAGVTTVEPPPARKPRRPAARITSEQKKAADDQEIIARQTGDQNEVRAEVDTGTAVIAVEDALRSDSQAAIESMPERVEAPTVFEPEIEKATVDTPPAVIEHSLKTRGLKISHEFVTSHQPVDDEVALGLEEQESWRRAAAEARRRAEERALLEMQSEVAETSLASRVLSQSQPVNTSHVASPSVWAEKLRWMVLSKPWLAGLVFAIPVALVLLFFLAQTRPQMEQDVSVILPGAGTTPKRDMVLVKGGSFMMGWDNGDISQRPAHIQAVQTFYLDRTEVTNKEYAEFVKATGYSVPTISEADSKTNSYWVPWNGNLPPPGREKMPVCNVTVKDAEAFAKWLSQRDQVTYRLPTEQEWEYAARNGEQNTLFPWGNSWLEGRANINGRSSPMPVGSFPEGATIVGGIVDMVGNAWEWTASKGSYYDPKAEVNKLRAGDRAANVLRGGSFAEVVGQAPGHSVVFANATSRAWNGEVLLYKHPQVGFRLARDP